jgi:hypothetical protein
MYVSVLVGMGILEDVWKSDASTLSLAHPRPEADAGRPLIPRIAI